MAGDGCRRISRLTCAFVIGPWRLQRGVVDRLGDWMGTGDRASGDLPSGRLCLEQPRQPAFDVLPSEHDAAADAEAPRPGTEMSPVTDRGDGRSEVGRSFVEGQQAR